MTKLIMVAEVHLIFSIPYLKLIPVTVFKKTKQLQYYVRCTFRYGDHFPNNYLVDIQFRLTTRICQSTKAH